MEVKHLEGGQLSVGQFSALVGASRSQLLYYDREKIFVPACRVGVGEQAPNRRYTLDQVLRYRMLCYFQQLGCTLEEASRYLDAPWAERLELLKRQEERLERETRRLQTMRESVALLMRGQRLCSGTRPDAPAFDALDAPRRGIYHALETPSARTTAAFAKAYIRHDEAVRDDPDILPAPTLLTYAVEADENSRFPVTGILSLFRDGAGQERSNYTLPAGRYMIFGISGTGGRLSGSLLNNRQYLQGHRIKRRGSVLAYNMGVTQTEPGAYYDECVLFPVCEGFTPPGQKPTTPGVE